MLSPSFLDIGSCWKCCLMTYITATPQSELVFDCCGVSSIGTSGSCTGRISSYLDAVLAKALFCKSVGVRVSGTVQYG